MRLGYLALAPLLLWPRALLAASAVAKDAQCAFLPFGRPQASHCIYIVNHIISKGNDPTGFVLRDYPKRPYLSIPIFWYYSQSISPSYLVYLLTPEQRPASFFSWPMMSRS